VQQKKLPVKQLEEPPDVDNQSCQETNAPGDRKRLPGIWTVRAGTQRILDVYTLRKLCDIGDEFADGHVRFTIRSNIEYMVDKEEKVEPLIKALGDAGFIVGGTQNTVAMISHTQGWLHCDIPGTDASGIVKSMMDELIHEFTHAEMPNRVHITTSCCQINCGGQGDIAINIQHTLPFARPW